ncbi:MAG: DUF4934 domain-containing protein [Muribaculaceae bacterium]|nr:DUF4934 domain-containing protein [Muribaculaceae bacterium]
MDRFKTVCSWAAVACAMVVAGCSAGSDGVGESVVDVAGAVGAPEVLKVSDLGSKITYAPLETTDSSLVPNTWQLVPTGSHLLVVNYDPWGMGKQNCMSFDISGKFLGIIGHTGDDPEAYSRPFPIVSADGKTLYFMRYGAEMYMQEYGIDGGYKGRVFPQIPPLGAQGVTQIVDTTIVSVDCNLHNFTKEMWVTIYAGGLNSRGVAGGVDTTVVAPMPDDYDGSLSFQSVYMNRFPSVMPHSVHIYQEYDEQGGERKHLFKTHTSTPRLVKVGKELHFKEPFIDTMYVVTPTSFTPIYTFDCGEKALNPSEVNTKGFSADNLWVTEVCESSDYIVFGACYGWLGNEDRKGYVGYYDKKTGKTRATAAENGFEDDLTGFMPFYPVVSNSRGDLIGILTIDDIDKWLETHPDAELPEPLRNLAEDANPICVIVSK